MTANIWFEYPRCDIEGCRPLHHFITSRYRKNCNTMRINEEVLLLRDLSELRYLVLTNRWWFDFHTASCIISGTVTSCELPAIYSVALHVYIINEWTAKVCLAAETRLYQRRPATLQAYCLPVAINIIRLYRFNRTAVGCRNTFQFISVRACGTWVLK